MRIHHLINVGPSKTLGLLTLPEIESDLRALWGDQYEEDMLNRFMEIYQEHPAYLCRLVAVGEEIFNGTCDHPTFFLAHKNGLHTMVNMPAMAEWAGFSPESGNAIHTLFNALIHKDALSLSAEPEVYKAIMDAYAHREPWIGRPPEDPASLDERLANLCKCGCAPGRFASAF
jgi:hypothetical protein